MRPELEAWIGPEQLPEPALLETRDGSACLAVVWLGGLVLAFLAGVLVGLAWGRIPPA